MTDKKALNMDSPEEWRPAVGYEGRYEVSSHGRVRSVDFNAIRKDGKPQRIRGKVLRPSMHRSGHLHLALYRGRKATSIRVHRLVAEAFIEKAANSNIQVVCHNDGNPLNNRVENLRWGTIASNNWDTVKHGAHHLAKRTHCRRGHLLDGPNIRGNGNRRCLSCNRARARIRNTAPHEDIQEVSDRIFQVLMRELPVEEMTAKLGARKAMESNPMLWGRWFAAESTWRLEQWNAERAKVEAVRALHRRMPVFEHADSCPCDDKDAHNVFEDSVGYYLCQDTIVGQTCEHCFELDDETEWPCPTIQAIERTA